MEEGIDIAVDRILDEISAKVVTEWEQEDLVQGGYNSGAAATEITLEINEVQIMAAVGIHNSLLDVDSLHKLAGWAIWQVQHGFRE